MNEEIEIDDFFKKCPTSNFNAGAAVEICGDYFLWQRCVDTNGDVSEKEFNNLLIVEKLKMLEKMNLIGKHGAQDYKNKTKKRK